MWDLSGPFVPIPTPLTDDGSGLSEIRLARVLRRVMELGAKGLVLCTETGEFTTNSFAERKHILELTLRETHSSLPIIVNVSSLNTSASLDLAQHAARHGARAVVMLSPYFGKYENKEVEAHFRTVAHYCQAPVVGIDPSGQFETAASLQLAEMGRFALATAMPGRALGTDSFQLDDMTVLADYNLSMHPIPALAEAVKAHGGIRVVKGALAEMDVDLGPVRQPYLALEHPVIRALVDSLSEAEGQPFEATSPDQ